MMARISKQPSPCSSKQASKPLYKPQQPTADEFPPLSRSRSPSKEVTVLIEAGTSSPNANAAGRPPLPSSNETTPHANKRTSITGWKALFSSATQTTPGRSQDASDKSINATSATAPPTPTQQDWADTSRSMHEDINRAVQQLHLLPETVRVQFDEDEYSTAYYSDSSLESESILVADGLAATPSRLRRPSFSDEHRRVLQLTPSRHLGPDRRREAATSPTIPLMDAPIRRTGLSIIESSATLKELVDDEAAHDADADDDDSASRRSSNQGKKKWEDKISLPLLAKANTASARTPPPWRWVANVDMRAVLWIEGVPSQITYAEGFRSFLENEMASNGIEFRDEFYRGRWSTSAIKFVHMMQGADNLLLGLDAKSCQQALLILNSAAFSDRVLAFLNGRLCFDQVLKLMRASDLGISSEDVRAFVRPHLYGRQFLETPSFDRCVLAWSTLPLAHFSERSLKLLRTSFYKSGHVFIAFRDDKQFFGLARMTALYRDMAQIQWEHYGNLDLEKMLRATPGQARPMRSFCAEEVEGKAQAVLFNTSRSFGAVLLREWRALASAEYDQLCEFNQMHISSDESMMRTPTNKPLMKPPSSVQSAQSSLELFQHAAQFAETFIPSVPASEPCTRSHSASSKGWTPTSPTPASDHASTSGDRLPQRPPQTPSSTRSSSGSRRRSWSQHNTASSEQEDETASTSKSFKKKPWKNYSGHRPQTLTLSHFLPPSSPSNACQE